MNFKDVLTSALPWIGAAATGNIPGLVAMAAKEVSDALGVKVAPTVEAMASAVAGATPEQQIALQKQEQDFKARMQEVEYKHSTDLATIELQREQAEYADIANARQQNVQTRDSTVRNLAYFIALAAIGACASVLFGWTSADSVIAGTIIGYLISEFKMVTGFYFGSTSSSKQNAKSAMDALSDATKK